MADVWATNATRFPKTCSRFTNMNMTPMVLFILQDIRFCIHSFIHSLRKYSLNDHRVTKKEKFSQAMLSCVTKFVLKPFPLTDKLVLLEGKLGNPNQTKYFFKTLKMGYSKHTCWVADSLEGLALGMDLWTLSKMHSTTQGDEKVAYSRDVEGLFWDVSAFCF